MQTMKLISHTYFWKSRISLRLAGVDILAMKNTHKLLPPNTQTRKILQLL